MIRSIMSFTPPASKRAEIKQSLKSMVEPIEVQPGCIKCYLPNCADKRVRIVCEWNSFDTLETFMAARLNARLMSFIELSDEEPELSFENISESFGHERFIPKFE